MVKFEEGEKYYCSFVDDGKDREVYYKMDNWINILKREKDKCKVEWHLSHLKPKTEEVEIYYNKDSRAIEENEVIAMPGNDDYEFFYIFHPYN